MVNKKYLSALFKVIVIAVVLSASTLTATAGVDVYAEGAYTETDLVVYIYADIDTDAVCSAGVKLSFDPGVVTVTNAEKNGDDWYMGAGVADHAYMDPEVDATNGTVTIICGKLDTRTATSPTDGVIGDRVLLGKVAFTIDSPLTSTPVSDPEEGFFGVGLELGRIAPYVNFATTGGSDIDGAVTFSSVIIKERGDANASRDITSADMFKIRSMLGTAEYIVYADCNESGDITSADMFCVRSKL